MPFASNLSLSTQHATSNGEMPMKVCVVESRDTGCPVVDGGLLFSSGQFAVRDNAPRESTRIGKIGARTKCGDTPSLVVPPQMIVTRCFHDRNPGACELATQSPIHSRLLFTTGVVFLAPSPPHGRHRSSLPGHDQLVTLVDVQNVEVGVYGGVPTETVGDCILRLWVRQSTSACGARCQHSTRRYASHYKGVLPAFSFCFPSP
jgi:hypothetical protein